MNNARFLILPWVRIRNLASSILALAARRIADDWEKVYHYRPVLLEAFVEEGRVRGTRDQAANWIQVGRTQGRGKLDRKHLFDKLIKAIYLYPLQKGLSGCAVRHHWKPQHGHGLVSVRKPASHHPDD